MDQEQGIQLLSRASMTLSNVKNGCSGGQLDREKKRQAATGMLSGMAEIGFDERLLR